MTGIKLVIAVTDGDWFEMLRQHPDVGEVNFRAPSAVSFRALKAGDIQSVVPYRSSALLSGVNNLTALICTISPLEPRLPNQNQQSPSKFQSWRGRTVELAGQRVLLRRDTALLVEISAAGWGEDVTAAPRKP